MSTAPTSGRVSPRSEVPKTVSFDGARFQVRHLAARLDVDPDEATHEDVLGALLALTVRRCFGRRAWVHHARRDSWTADGSLTVYEVTAATGARTEHGTPVRSLWVTAHRGELAAALAALRQR